MDIAFAFLFGLQLGQWLERIAQWRLTQHRRRNDDEPDA